MLSYGIGRCQLCRKGVLDCRRSWGPCWRKPWTLGRKSSLFDVSQAF